MTTLYELLSKRLTSPAYPTVAFPGATEKATNPPEWYARAKAGVDFVLAALLLVATAPVILMLMVLVKLTSAGPALFTQVRLGRGGNPFTIYKIRTMAHDCERRTGPRWATANDPRATALGRVLRQSHLDELPQLWNVVRGDMSLVGPRPERPEFVSKLELAVPDYRERLRVRPGITGLAQVQLPPDTDLESVQRKVAADLCYIRQMSGWLDVRLLAATALKLVSVPAPVMCRLLRLPAFRPDVPRDAG